MNYPVKVWFFTISVSPLILVLALWFYNSRKLSEIITGVPLLMLFFFFGLVVSLPALFLFWLSYRVLQSKAWKGLIWKLIFSLLGISLVWITFFILDRKFLNEPDFNNMVWPLAYSVCLFIGTSIFGTHTQENVTPLN